MNLHFSQHYRELRGSAHEIDNVPLTKFDETLPSEMLGGPTFAVAFDIAEEIARLLPK